jgi:hypothetical protein
MNKKYFLFAIVFGLFSFSDAGSCADHIKFAEISNIQTEGGEILVRSANFKLGQSFQWSVPGGSTFRITSSQNAEFKKNALVQLITAKTFSETVHIQVSYVGPSLFQIEKISVGESTLGLECSSYP